MREDATPELRLQEQSLPEAGALPAAEQIPLDLPEALPDPGQKPVQDLQVLAPDREDPVQVREAELRSEGEVRATKPSP